VASKNSVTYSFKHFSTIIGKISSFIIFQEGKTTFGSSCNARCCIQRFLQLFRRRNPLAIRSTKSCKKVFEHSSCFL
jgi:hypothetical protein